MIGAQTFDALGRRWTMFLGTSARCAVEERFDRGFFAVVSDAMPDIDPQSAMAVAAAMSAQQELPPALAEKATKALRGMRVSVLRDLAWHGLVRQHADVTPEMVDQIIDEIGDEAFGALLQRAIARTEAKAEAGDAGRGNGAAGKPARPTRPQKPTGPRSSRSGASSG